MMNCFALLLCFIASPTGLFFARLTVITERMPHTGHFYKLFQSDAKPPAWEREGDPETRKQICEVITSSDYFLEKGMEAAFVDDTNNELLLDEKYWEYYEEIFTLTDTDDYYENPYRSRMVTFLVDSSVKHQMEYTFLCLVRAQVSGELIPYYISKEYDIGTVFVQLHARFIFEKEDGQALRLVALAEEPAEVDVRLLNPDFNIELYYIDKRRIYDAEKTVRYDPICDQVPYNIPNNQHDRICAKALGSSYFEGAIKLYPRPLAIRETCFKQEVSFRTPLGAWQAGDRKYYEWMVHCQVRDARSDVARNYMISRAYALNRVFVYTYSPGDEKAYLENLTGRIYVADIPDPIVRTKFWS